MCSANMEDGFHSRIRDFYRCRQTGPSGQWAAAYEVFGIPVPYCQLIELVGDGSDVEDFRQRPSIALDELRDGYGQLGSEG